VRRASKPVSGISSIVLCARVVVEQAGGATQMRELHAVNGFSAQSDRRMLFGFGTRPGTIAATVDWCGSGIKEQVTLAPGQYHRLVQSL